jgi:hypothetical protein
MSMDGGLAFWSVSYCCFGAIERCSLHSLFALPPPWTAPPAKGPGKGFPSCPVWGLVTGRANLGRTRRASRTAIAKTACHGRRVLRRTGPGAPNLHAHTRAEGKSVGCSNARRPNWGKGPWFHMWTGFSGYSARRYRRKLSWGGGTPSRRTATGQTRSGQLERRLIRERGDTGGPVKIERSPTDTIS